jgi:hypothetical protein
VDFRTVAAAGAAFAVPAFAVPAFAVEALVVVFGADAEAVLVVAAGARRVVARLAGAFAAGAGASAAALSAAVPVSAATVSGAVLRVVEVLRRAGALGAGCPAEAGAASASVPGTTGSAVGFVERVRDGGPAGLEAGSVGGVVLAWLTCPTLATNTRIVKPTVQLCSARSAGASTPFPAPPAPVV